MLVGDYTSKKKPEKLEGEKNIELPTKENVGLVEHNDVKELEGPEKVKELEERLLRLRADFENYKKRSEKENDTVKEASTADVLLKLLPVIDEFELAISHKCEDRNFMHGIEMIYAKLLDLLKKEGVEEMKAVGETFDPYKHDAIREGEGEEGKIVEVIQKGYIFKGKILRHAKVVVGKKVN